jgi:Flp pilus assembly pilin Flp
MPAWRPKPSLLRLLASNRIISPVNNPSLSYVQTSICLHRSIEVFLSEIVFPWLSVNNFLASFDLAIYGLLRRLQMVKFMQTRLALITFSDKRAITSIEYAIIASLIMMVIVASVTSIGHEVKEMFVSLAPVL